MSLCPICNREMNANLNEHHWLPVSKGGKIKSLMHRVCHDKIHHVFSEAELANCYNTPEALLSHAEISKFVSWIKRKPVDFYVKHKDTNDRRNRR